MSFGFAFLVFAVELICLLSGNGWNLWLVLLYCCGGDVCWFRRFLGFWGLCSLWYILICVWLELVVVWWFVDLFFVVFNNFGVELTWLL